ncbi:MAG: hypothetical protein ACXWQO_09645 [Bdellovibrionota bacterium]
MRFTVFILSSLVAGSAFASVERQQPYEEISRALQQAKRVATTEVFPNRAFLLGQRVAQNSKSIALQEVKPEPKRSKKARKPSSSL